MYLNYVRKFLNEGTKRNRFKLKINPNKNPKDAPTPKILKAKWRTS